MKTYLILLSCILGSHSIFVESLQAADRLVQIKPDDTTIAPNPVGKVPPPPAPRVSPWICDCSCGYTNKNYKFYCEILNTQVKYLTSKDPDLERAKEGVAILGSLGKLPVNTETVSNPAPPVKCCVIPYKACQYLSHLVLTNSKLRLVAVNSLAAIGENALPQLREIVQDQRNDLAHARLVSMQAIANIFLTESSDQPKGEILVKIITDDTNQQIRKIALNGLIKKSNSALDPITKNEAILKSVKDVEKIAQAKKKIEKAKPEFLTSLSNLNTVLNTIDLQKDANSIVISKAVSQAISELLAGKAVTIEGESKPDIGEAGGAGGGSTAGGVSGMASSFRTASELPGVSEYSELSQIRSSRYPKRLASEATIPDANVHYPRRMATQDTQLPILGLTDPFPQVGAKKKGGAGPTPGFLDISPNSAFNITPPNFISPETRVP